MSNKVTKDVKARLDDDDGDVELYARGSFCVFFSKNSEIARMLDVKIKEKFRVTLERI